MDKTIRPRHMTMERQNQSIHYFQIYAAQDRIDFRGFSNDVPIKKDLNLPLSFFLPTVDDSNMLRQNYATLIAREVVRKLPYFSKIFGDCVPMHIHHKYSDDMCKKSELVSVKSSVRAFI